jgi:hypothetical protein
MHSSIIPTSPKAGPILQSNRMPARALSCLDVRIGLRLMALLVLQTPIPTHVPANLHVPPERDMERESESERKRERERER